MTHSAIQFVAEVAGVSGLAASRPALTLWVVQLAFVIREKLADDPSLPHHWLVSPVAVGVGLLAVMLELLIEHEDDLEEVLRSLHVDKLFRALCVVATTELVVLEVSSGSAPLLRADAPSWKAVAIVSGAVALNLLLTVLRGKLVARLGDLGLKGLWQRLETGGVIVFLGLLLVSPVLVIGILIGLVGGLACLALAARAVEIARDRRSRRACPVCQALIRVEAVTCRKCHADLLPDRWLAPARAAE